MGLPNAQGPAYIITTVHFVLNCLQGLYIEEQLMVRRARQSHIRDIHNVQKCIARARDVLKEGRHFPKPRGDYIGIARDSDLNFWWCDSLPEH